MITKFGKVKAVAKKDEIGRGGGTLEVEILVQNISNRNWTYMSIVSYPENGITNPPYSVQAFRGLNPEKDEDIIKLIEPYTFCGVESMTWLEPLTVVE